MELLLQPIDIYCERLAHGFWEEPLNALSNISFIIAAILLYRLQKQNLLLIGLLALVGIGSFSFHTYANTLGLIADIGGIMIFVHTYLYFALRRLLGWGKTKSIIGIAGFFTLLVLAAKIPATYNFNGSAAYFPCLLLIGWIWLKIRHTHKHTKYLIYAGCIFAMSLFFRSIDIVLCDIIPTGTHMYWHLLNGAVLYYLMKALIQSGKPTN